MTKLNDQDDGSSKVRNLLAETRASLQEGAIKLQALDLLPSDPRLQLALEKRRRGLTPAATSSTERGEIAVVARVSDIEAWRGMTEVRLAAEIGPNAKKEWIVTGRMPVSRLGTVRNAKHVRSLKPPLRIKPALSKTITEIQAKKDLLPAAAQGDQGKGVVVGIVDFGCDFAHKNFRKANGSTRLLALWDQSGSSTPSSPFGYGRLYEAAEINKALKKARPYDSLGYNPGVGEHGTHVMDIAAGNGKGTGVPGVAPNADLVFVHLAGTDVPWEGEGVVGKSFGDSVQLLEAVRFIFDRAKDRPCVINLSLGTNGGPHDGSTLVEQGMDLLVRERPNRAIVIAASNSYADGIHASGSVAAGGYSDLLWRVTETDWTQNELEVWYHKKDKFRLELIAPSGESLGSVALGSSARLRDEQGRTLVFIAHRRGDPNNGDNVAGVFLENRLPGGDWTIRLHGVVVKDGSFHAWIERDDTGPSTFVPPHDNTHTLGSISSGEASIVVGSYDAYRQDHPLSWFSSAGPTRDGREKPEVSAPGHEVWAAKSGTWNGAIRMSGTSMASPAVAGVAALVLAESSARGVDLSAEQIRNLVIKTARTSPPASAWDPRYGWGRVDASQAVKRVFDAARPKPFKKPAPRKRQRGGQPRAQVG